MRKARARVIWNNVGDETMKCNELREVCSTTIPEGLRSVVCSVMIRDRIGCCAGARVRVRRSLRV